LIVKEKLMDGLDISLDVLAGLLDGVTYSG
jgi:hypothetical protein